jgi:hypothetical protein
LLAGVLQDVEVLPLIKDESAVWTFGANTMNIDYEARWNDYLAEDDFKAKGAAPEHFPTATAVYLCCAVAHRLGLSTLL